MKDKERDKILKEANGLISIGRAIVRKKSPYISTTLYGLVFRPVWEPGVTFGVTPGLVCYFNPVWLVNDPEIAGKDGKDVIAGDIFHECWHPIHGFARLERLKKRGMELGMSEREAMKIANVSDDCNINYMARKAGYRLQEWVCYPESFGIKSGLTMEETWLALVEQRKEILQQFELPGSGTSGLGGDGEADDAREGDQKGQPGGAGAKWKPGPCSGDCGGTAGAPATEEKKGIEKELDAQFGRHAADRDRIRRVTVQEMQNHEQRFGRGSCPGFREELVDFIKEKPLVRWQRQLRHVLTRCSGNIVSGDEEYSQLRPDKNSMLLGICMPSLIDQEPEVAFIRDTSGSVGTTQLNSANNEIIYAMNALGLGQVWLLDADVQTQGRPRRVSTKDLPRIPVRGRGGTSFIQPLEVAAKLSPRPDIVIYLTDGDGCAPDRPPRGIHVIWCILPGSYRKTKPADWGHIIVCSNDRTVREAYDDL